MQEGLEVTPPWLNTERAAKYAGFKKTTFNKFRSVGGGPLYSKSLSTKYIKDYKGV